MKESIFVQSIKKTEESKTCLIHVQMFLSFDALYFHCTHMQLLAFSLTFSDIRTSRLLTTALLALATASKGFYVASRLVETVTLTYVKICDCTYITALKFEAISGRRFNKVAR